MKKEKKPFYLKAKMPKNIYKAGTPVLNAEGKTIGKIVEDTTDFSEEGVENVLILIEDPELFSLFDNSKTFVSCGCSQTKDQ